MTHFLMFPRFLELPRKLVDRPYLMLVLAGSARSQLVVYVSSDSLKVMNHVRFDFFSFLVIIY